MDDSTRPVNGVKLTEAAAGEGKRVRRPVVKRRIMRPPVPGTWDVLDTTLPLRETMN